MMTFYTCIQIYMLDRYLCLYIYMYIRTFTYMHIYMYIYIHVYIYTGLGLNIGFDNRVDDNDDVGYSKCERKGGKCIFIYI
jgi:hypothetical protein